MQLRAPRLTADNKASIALLSVVAGAFALALSKEEKANMMKHISVSKVHGNDTTEVFNAYVKNPYNLRPNQRGQALDFNYIDELGLAWKFKKADGYIWEVIDSCETEDPTGTPVVLYDATRDQDENAPAPTSYN